MKPVHILPAFTDNYLFCLELDSGFWAVDPGDALTIENFLQKQSLPLLGILLTHHHLDHSGGAMELAVHHKVPIFCSELTAEHLRARHGAASVTTHCKPLEADSSLALLMPEFRIIGTPGHTLDHVSYYHSATSSLFSGDVVFGFGCGRLFEGTAEQMMETLAKICQLPDTTQIYCAHEYTEKNLAFAERTLKSEELQQARLDLQKRFESQNHRSVPLTLGFEKRYNPFLRIKNREQWTQLRLERNSF